MNILREYRKMAAAGDRFRGLSVLAHAEQIGELVRRYQSQRLLDYGCGAGDQYRPPHSLHELWGVPMPTLFDPSFEHNRPPRGRFDGVICSDVLEHLPSSAVGPLLRVLILLATDWVFASVCCRPASKTFPNGKNLHLTVEPLEWWMTEVKAAAAWAAEHQGHAPQFILVETP